MMTQSNASRASSISRRMRSEVRPAIGSDARLPAGRSASRSETWRTGSLPLLGRREPLGQARARCRCRRPCAATAGAGRRRSAARCAGTTRCSVSARFAAVSVLPSPGTALAIITTLRPLSRLRVVQRRRQPPVLLARHGLHVRVDDDLLGERLVRSARTATSGCQVSDRMNRAGGVRRRRGAVGVGRSAGVTHDRCGRRRLGSAGAARASRGETARRRDSSRRLRRRSTVLRRSCGDVVLLRLGAQPPGASPRQLDSWP